MPDDGFIVTDVGWNKNGVGQQFPITVPGTFITPRGLATMGFGPAAVLGGKSAHPDRAAGSLIGDGGVSPKPWGIASAEETEQRGRTGLVIGAAQDRLEQLAHLSPSRTAARARARRRL